MSTQLKREAEPVEDIIETYVSGDEPIYRLGGDSVILTYRQPYLDDEGRASAARGDCALYMIKDNGSVGGLYRPTYRLEAMTDDGGPQYYVLEYDGDKNEYVLMYFDHRDDSSRQLIEFESEVPLQNIAYSDGRVFCWGIDRDNLTFAVWAADFTANDFRRLWAQRTSHWFSAACHRGEIFFGGHGAIFRQSFEMAEPELFCETAGEIFDIAIVEGNVMYLGDLPGGERGLREINLEDGAELRTVPIDRAGTYGRLTVHNSKVFVCHNAVFDPLENILDFPRIDYLDESGRLYPVAVSENADIDSLHASYDALYWVEISPALTMPMLAAFDPEAPPQYTVRRIMIENLPAAEIVDAERLSVKVAVSAEVKEYEDDYERRNAIYAELFGPVDNEVGMLVNLRTNCPGMCIMFSKPEKLPYPQMACTFGLAGVRAGTGLTSSTTRTSGGTDVEALTITTKLEKGTALSRGRLAGYGFELVAATNVAGQWLSRLLADMARQQVAGEFDFFFHVTDSGAVLAGPYTSHLGLLGEETNYLIAPAWGSMPKEADAGNGKISFFTLMNVTAAELRFAKRQGAKALLEKYRKAGVEPLIDPSRKSVV